MHLTVPVHQCSSGSQMTNTRVLHWHRAHGCGGVCVSTFDRAIAKPGGCRLLAKTKEHLDIFFSCISSSYLALCLQSGNNMTRLFFFNLLKGKGMPRKQFTFCIMERENNHSPPLFKKILFHSKATSGFFYHTGNNLFCHYLLSYPETSPSILVSPQNPTGKN